APVPWRQPDDDCQAYASARQAPKTSALTDKPPGTRIYEARRRRHSNVTWAAVFDIRPSKSIALPKLPVKTHRVRSAAYRGHHSVTDRRPHLFRRRRINSGHIAAAQIATDNHEPDSGSSGGDIARRSHLGRTNHQYDIAL